MVISHNLVAMNAQRQYNMVGLAKSKTTEKLSSGYRINRAADDAAGLAISEKMRRQIRGLTKGVENTQDGVSLCQVADGALAEVHDMLHRVTELSVKAANGTLTTNDREYIQEEITQILSEIDRIGDTTTFNERPVFKGTDEVICGPDGRPLSKSSIPINDFTLADVDLGMNPINNSSQGALSLQARVTNPASPANGVGFNLIYGNGSTSNSSTRVTYTDAGGNTTSKIINLSDMAISNYAVSGNTWSRDLNYSDGDLDFTITQSVTLDEVSDTEKNYNFTYNLKNNGSSPITAEFMFHADTAYNNNDRCEAYFVDGTKISNVSIYSNDDTYLNSTASNIYSGVPSSFSIVDTDNALAFSEKIEISGANSPIALSVGGYSNIRNWDYYNNNASGKLGSNTNRMDLGFSLMWKVDMAAGENKPLEFKYGITSVDSDPNLKDVPITKDTRTATKHYNYMDVFIHSGVEAGDGINVIIDEMNTDVLGIKGLDVTTVKGAEDAITATKGALQAISLNRSKIGAQQNRLEHTIDNENNIVENTTAAESRIRDTDMAKTMVQFSVQNILAQAGESMMTQANQSKQGVLSLLQ